MSIFRQTYFKQFDDFTLFIYLNWSLASYLITIFLMSWFYLKMQSRKILNMLKVYQFVWIIYSVLAFVNQTLRALEIFDISGLFKTKMLPMLKIKLFV